MTWLPDGWDAWDAVRATNTVLAVTLVAAIAYRLVSRWRALNVEERYLWQALAVLAGATAYAAVDLIGSGVPGGTRLVLFTAALAFGHAALHHGRKRRRPRTTKEKPHA